MKKKYWYVCHSYYCPACGCEKRERERVYMKPDNYWVHHEHYDYCIEYGNL